MGSGEFVIVEGFAGSGAGALDGFAIECGLAEFEAFGGFNETVKDFGEVAAGHLLFGVDVIVEVDIDNGFGSGVAGVWGEPFFGGGVGEEVFVDREVVVVGLVGFEEDFEGFGEVDFFMWVEVVGIVVVDDVFFGG